MALAEKGGGDAGGNARICGDEMFKLDALIKAGKTGLAERVWDQRLGILCAFQGLRRPIGPRGETGHRFPLVKIPPALAMHSSSRSS